MVERVRKHDKITSFCKNCEHGIKPWVYCNAWLVLTIDLFNMEPYNLFTINLSSTNMVDVVTALSA